MRWQLSWRSDDDARPLADRHYNRQNPGATHFVPPGKCLVFLAENEDALWVTSWPKAEYVRHAWAGAWVNTLFRNESDYLSSELILEAISASRFLWNVPDDGLITFIDNNEVKSTNPGYCYLQAGFEKDGRTEGGLYAVHLPPERMPEPKQPKLKCESCSHKYCEQLREMA